MRIGAGLSALVAVVAALAAAGCTDPGADPATVATPTYLPADLPGGFGDHPLRYDRAPDGYVLTARAHDTTYTVRVRRRATGETGLVPVQLASLDERTTIGDDGTIHWRDQVADVSVSAVGPVGHVRRGLRTTGKRMIVVPQSVLDEFVRATRADRRRLVNIEPIEFVDGRTVIPQTLFGRLGRVSISVETGPVKSGTGVCWGCESPERVLGWRDGRTTMTLVLTPRSTVVVPSEGVRIERRYDAANGTDAVLLSTERSDEPHFFVGVPHHRLHRWTMRDDTPFL